MAAGMYRWSRWRPQNPRYEMLRPILDRVGAAVHRPYKPQKGVGVLPDSWVARNWRSFGLIWQRFQIFHLQDPLFPQNPYHKTCRQPSPYHRFGQTKGYIPQNGTKQPVAPRGNPL